VTADPDVLLADVLCAAADDQHVPLSRRDAGRVARRAVEMLALFGYRVTREEVDE
jgi:hypothetical protein